MVSILSASVRTDASLLEALRESAQRRMSREEALCQRVSYIVGAMSDEKTEITKDMVERELEKMGGGV